MGIEALRPIPLKLKEKKLPPEEGKEKPINPEKMGLQGLLMAGCGAMPKSSETLEKINTRLEKISNGEAGIDIDTKNINKGSLWERMNYWDQEEYKNLKFEEKLIIWKKDFKGFVDKFSGQPEKKEVFKKFGINPDSEKVADEAYEIYIQDGAGDIGVFAKKVKKLKVIEIEHNPDIILGLGQMYGKDSAEIADQLGKGLKNMDLDPEGFIKNAKANIQKGDDMPGKELMDNLEVNIKKWDDFKGGKPGESGGGPTKEQLAAKQIAAAQAKKEEDDKKKAAEEKAPQGKGQTEGTQQQHSKDEKGKGDKEVIFEQPIEAKPEPKKKTKPKVEKVKEEKTGTTDKPEPEGGNIVDFKKTETKIKPTDTTRKTSGKDNSPKK